MNEFYAACMDWALDRFVDAFQGRMSGAFNKPARN
jgi:hypothetical protein